MMWQIFGQSALHYRSGWVAAWQNQQNEYAQQRLRLAWASAQSDQSLHCPREESLGPKLPIEHTAKTLIRLGGCPAWSESSLGHTLILLVLSYSGSGCVEWFCTSSLVDDPNYVQTDDLFSMGSISFHSTLHCSCQWSGSVEMNRLMTKPTKWHVRPAKTQISLGIRPVWSESSLCIQWVAKDPSFLHVDSEDYDQT